jgi:F-type H+-transporting ATPase subunit b
LIGSNLINLIVTTATEEGHGFNWRFVTEYTINFIVLFAVLVYYLKDAVRNFLIERRGTIGNAIDEAQKIIIEARSGYEEYAKKMGEIDKEIGALKETLRKEGEVERAEILSQAESTSQKIKAEVKETIRLESAKAREEIQSETISSAIKIAEGIIKQNLGDSDERRFIDDFIKKIEEEKWRQSQH